MAQFESFYQDLKSTEQQGAALISEQQIDRLLKPGSTYLNLNPYEVLQIDLDTNIEAAKKKYKKLSLLVHPDKNPDDRERADKAFDIVKKAIKQMEDPIELNRCKDCYTEAKARLAIVMSEKKRKLRKNGKNDVIDEDGQAGYKKALWITVTKVFADREKKRKMLEERANDEKRWRNFQAKKARKEHQENDSFVSFVSDGDIDSPNIRVQDFHNDAKFFAKGIDCSLFPDDFPDEGDVKLEEDESYPKIGKIRLDLKTNDIEIDIDACLHCTTDELLEKFFSDPI